MCARRMLTLQISSMSRCCRASSGRLDEGDRWAVRARVGLLAAALASSALARPVAHSATTLVARGHNQHIARAVLAAARNWRVLAGRGDIPEPVPAGRSLVTS